MATDKDRSKEGKAAAGRARVLIAAVVAASLIGAAALYSHGRLAVLTVSANSMELTLCSGDRLILRRLTSETADNAWLRRHLGSEIVFVSNGKLTIKRLAGLAGDRMIAEEDALLRNGDRVADFRRCPSKSTGDPVITTSVIEVPANFMYVLGDNYASSVDSRHHGAYPVASIVGSPILHLSLPWGDCSCGSSTEPKND